MRIVVMLIAVATLPLGAAFAQTQAPQGQAPQAQVIKPPKIDPEFQQTADQRAAERKKLADCQKQAQEKKLLPRYATKFLSDCMDK